MMKFNTWQLVAIGALLLGGIVASHFYSPGNVALFVSMFAALMGLLTQKSPPTPTDPPQLTLIKGGLAAGALAFFLTLASVAACSPGLTPAQEADLGHTTSQITNCQIVGRTCKAFDAGACFEKYDACIKDAGLR